MAINEQDRQLEIATEVEELSRTLAHSTRTVPQPFDSYGMLGELRATADHLAQVLEQLSRWHSKVQDGVHYEGDGDPTERALSSVASELDEAARTVIVASEYIGRAHTSNSVVRWYQTPQQ